MEVVTMDGRRQTKKGEEIKVESILSLTDNWEDLPKPEDIKISDDEDPENILVIFDDALVMYEKNAKFRAYVDKLYIAGRHFFISPMFFIYLN